MKSTGRKFHSISPEKNSPEFLGGFSNKKIEIVSTNPGNDIVNVFN